MTEQVHSEIRQEINLLREDIREDIAELRSDIKRLYNNGISELGRKQASIEERVNWISWGVKAIIVVEVGLVADLIIKAL